MLQQKRRRRSFDVARAAVARVAGIGENLGCRLPRIEVRLCLRRDGAHAEHDAYMPGNKASHHQDRQPVTRPALDLIGRLTLDLNEWKQRITRACKTYVSFPTLAHDWHCRANG